MARKLTNYNLALDVARANPVIADYLKATYDTDGQVVGIDDSRLSLFEANPVIANEFFASLSNQIVEQYAYDVFRGFDMPFNWALKPMSRLGDAEMYVSATLADVGDYGDGTDPFSAPKPNIINNFIKTEARKQIGVRIAEDIMAGAFISEKGLSNIVGIILKNLRDSVQLFIYNQLKTYVANATAYAPYKVCTAVASSGDTANAQACYEEIMELVNSMSLPSTEYNTQGVETITPRGRFVLLLNSKYKASFDINVLASLFNSSKIELDKYFREVRVIDFPTNVTNQFGIIMDDEALVWGYRLDKTGAIYNPRTMELNTWINSWLKWGAITSRNAVRLLDSAQA